MLQNCLGHPNDASIVIGNLTDCVVVARRRRWWRLLLLLRWFLPCCFCVACPRRLGRRRFVFGFVAPIDRPSGRVCFHVQVFSGLTKQVSCKATPRGIPLADSANC